MLPLCLFLSSSRPCRCGFPMLYPLHLPKESVLLMDIQSRYPFFNLSRNDSCQSVRRRDVESSNGCDSGLLLELEVERWNSKNDL
uniref:Uncharacterized protein n=1 Tax=Araneus ventricosus TaxID=182803 RepID=A0A4Y2KYU0_ARAVE|nr:hypothetical protein AVEN_96750-1 [Araneus ventricosus]